MRLSGNLSLFVVWTVAGVLLTGQAAHPLHAQAWSVQDLRDAVAAGGDILVPAGQYVLDAPLMIDRQVNLTMAPGAQLLAADWNPHPNESLVWLVAGSDGSELHGLHIDGQGNRLTGLQLGRWEQTAPGVWVPIGVSNVLIQDLKVANVGETGLQVMASEHITVRNAHLVKTMLHDDEQKGAALTVRNSSSNVLIENIVVREAGGKGVGISDSNEVILRDAIIYDTHWDAGDGIHTTRAHNVLIDNARVFDSQGNALKISRNSNNVTVIDSMFNKHNRGVGSALHLQGGANSDLSGSIFINQSSGGQAIRVADHPSPSLALAVDNDLYGNHVVHSGGNYLNDSGQNTTYQDNDESRRPQIAWVNQFGLAGLGMHNLTTGEVHFEGAGIERGRVGEAVDEFDSLYGTWRTVNNDVTIVDKATTGVDAFTGSRFIRLQGAADGVDRPQLTSASPISQSGSIGDQTQTSFAFRVDEGVLRVRVRGDEGNFADILFYDDGTIEGHDGDDRFTLNMTHNVGEWNVAVVDYILGATESFLSVNNAAGEIVGARAVTSNLQDINFRNEGDAAFLAYIDAIPEPASIGLLGAGALLLLRRDR